MVCLGALFYSVYKSFTQVLAFLSLTSYQVLPSQPGVRPDYLRDLRLSVLKDLPYDKRNPLLVTVQLFFLSLRDVITDPYKSGAKIFAGLHGGIAELPMIGIVAATLITIWGLRLSYNFWRKVSVIVSLHNDFLCYLIAAALKEHSPISFDMAPVMG